MPERPSWFRTERPERIEVYFCSVCGFACGILDYDRIQHEHFDQEGSLCRGGRFDIRAYEAAKSSALSRERSCAACSVHLPADRPSHGLDGRLYCGGCVEAAHASPSSQRQPSNSDAETGEGS